MMYHLEWNLLYVHCFKMACITENTNADKSPQESNGTMFTTDAADSRICPTSGWTLKVEYL